MKSEDNTAAAAPVAALAAAATAAPVAALAAAATAAPAAVPVAARTAAPVAATATALLLLLLFLLLLHMYDVADFIPSFPAATTPTDQPLRDHCDVSSVSDTTSVRPPSALPVLLVFVPKLLILFSPLVCCCCCCYYYS